MTVITDFYKTTIGKKIAMAVSGLVLVGFVLSHMIGNLKIFGGINRASGRYMLDEYAEALEEIASHFLGHETFLWIARVVLLSCLVIHVVSAIALARLNREAKGVSPRHQDFRSANAASRSMLFGGLFLLAFIIFHILHFTTGTVHTRNFQEGFVYANVWNGFQILPVTIFYITAMALLCLHLYHGTWSMFQTLGVTTPRWNEGIRTLAKVVAIVLFLGFSAVPVAASLKLIDAPQQTPGPSHAE